MSVTANWSYPTNICFGIGRVNEVSQACQQCNISKPLVVADAGLATTGMVTRLLGSLEQTFGGSGLFSDVYPNPTDVMLDQGLEIYRAGGYDGVVAIGGGSALDLGKIIAFMSGQRRPVWDFEDISDYWQRADNQGIAPIIAIPTTSGTGSEVGRAGLLTNSQEQIKKIIFHPNMLPSVVICDPELTQSLPPALTAGTGLDAFIHSFEAFCSLHYHPMSQGIALEGMRLVKDNLLRVYHDGKDLTARGHMMSAAAMGAVAFQKGLGAVHALSHPLGALYNTPHGMTNAIALLAVVRFNRPAIEEKINLLSAYLSIDNGFDGFYAWLEQFLQTLNIPNSMTALGVDRHQINKLAAMAVTDPSAGGNPIPLTETITRGLYEQII